MALPTDPTATALATEAYRKARTPDYTPTAAELTRAGVWMQELFNEIAFQSERNGDTRLKTLQTTLYFTSVKGKRTYDLAEDFEEEFTVTILDGTVRGTAQGGAAGTLTLAADDGMAETTAVGSWIYLTGGTGSAQMRQITAYNTTTKVATLDSSWTTTPDNTSTYLLVHKTKRLTEDNQIELDDLSPSSMGMPSYFSKYGRQLIFDRPFNLSTYGIRVRYFANINQIDLVEGASTLITRIYRNWQSVLVKGLFWKVLEGDGDAQSLAAKKDFENMLPILVNKERPYGGEFEGFRVA